MMTTTMMTAIMHILFLADFWWLAALMSSFPACWVCPCPMRRPSRTITQPTGGLGEEMGRARRAWDKAACIHVVA